VKKLLLFSLMVTVLLAGCTTSQPPPGTPPPSSTPPLPPMPKLRKAAKIESPKAMSAAAPRVLSAVVPAPTPTPTWIFTNLNGNYQIDASTNLVNWWPMAVVYNVTNVTLSSDTVNKRPILFYRVRPAE